MRTQRSPLQDGSDPRLWVDPVPGTLVPQKCQFRAHNCRLQIFQYDAEALFQMPAALLHIHTHPNAMLNGQTP